ncbi:MAG: helix-turn-helix domain-containing protein [Coprobacillus sp.]
MISQNLVYLRKSKKVSLEELAEAIGVSRQAISKWENGETIPDLPNTIALANFYNITVDDLISRKTENSDGRYVFGMVTVGDRGQVVIPKKAREVFGISAGDNLIVLGDTNQGGMALAKVNAEAFNYFMDGEKNDSNQNK